MTTFDPKAFLEFVRSKPASETYPAHDYCRCALGQFGFKDVWMHELKGVPVKVLKCATTGPYNFGALASRLEKVIQ